MCQARFIINKKFINLSHVHLSVTCSCTWWALSKYKVMWRTYMWRLPYENPSLCLAVLLQAFESTLIHKWQLCSFVPGDEKLCCNHSCNPSPFLKRHPAQDWSLQKFLVFRYGWHPLFSASTACWEFPAASAERVPQSSPYSQNPKRQKLSDTPLAALCRLCRQKEAAC